MDMPLKTPIRANHINMEAMHMISSLDLNKSHTHFKGDQEIRQILEDKGHYRIPEDPELK